MMNAEFKTRLLGGDPLIGTWIKTPSMMVAELLGQTGLDCVCIDAEHSPFDRAAIDAGILGLNAGGMPALVRLPSLRAEHALSALDCGAVGIVAPHVSSADDAAELVNMCHYGPGGRGYAGSSRAAGYTSKSMQDHIAQSRAATAVIAQIEDVAALENIAEIAAVDGVDCLFIGRMDLTVAMGASSPTDPAVIDAVEHICAIGAQAGRAIGMFVGDLDEIPRWINAGARLFILKSDHTFMLEGARRLRQDFDTRIDQAR